MDDFVPGRAAFVATRGAGLVLAFLDSFGDAFFFIDFDMVVFPVLEPTIGAPTTQSPQFAGCHHVLEVSLPPTAALIPSTNASLAPEVQSNVPFDLRSPLQFACGSFGNITVGRPPARCQ